MSHRDRDRWRAANLLIREQGGGLEFVAARCADRDAETNRPKASSVGDSTDPIKQAQFLDMPMRHTRKTVGHQACGQDTHVAHGP